MSAAHSSLPPITVGDVMSDRYIIVDGLETVATAVAKAQPKRAKCIIVDKRDQYDEYGLVLLSDVAKQVVASNRSPQRVNIYEIMSKPVIAVPPDMNIRYAARLFDAFGLHLAPVISRINTPNDVGETAAAAPILGVVSYTDIVLQGLIADQK